MLEHGVPYEMLLAQRAVGGAWLSHRNATTSLLPPLLATTLCELLDERDQARERAEENAREQADLDSIGLMRARLGALA